MNVGGRPCSGLSRQAQLGLSQALLGCCEAPPPYFSCAWGRCLVGRSEVLSTLEVFLQDLPVLGRIHLPSTAASRPVRAAEPPPPHSLTLPPPCFTAGTGDEPSGFLHTPLRLEANVLSVSSDQRILFPTISESFRSS